MITPKIAAINEGRYYKACKINTIFVISEVIQ